MEKRVGDWLVLVIALAFGAIALVDSLTQLPRFLSSGIEWVSTANLVLLISVLYFMFRFNHKA